VKNIALSLSLICVFSAECLTFFISHLHHSLSSFRCHSLQFSYFSSVILNPSFVANEIMNSARSDPFTDTDGKGKKVKLSLYQAMEAHRVVRR
jgi:hypothetical protein